MGHGARVKLPLFTSLRGYHAGWLRGDLVAGLTVWAVLVPEALAYASIAGVSPVVGLYAAPGALLLYAAFGSSRHLVTGPMSATAALSAAAVADVATPNSAGFLAHTTALAITTGFLVLVAGLLRLGFLASFISEPVLKGFIIGLALTIVVGQLPELFGVEKGSGNFFEKLWDLLTRLGQTSGTTLAVGLASLALVLGLRRLAPVVPGSLVAVLAGILAVALLGLDRHGVEIVGQIDSGLPAFGLPGVKAADYLALAPAAAGIMLVGFAEGLGAAKTYAAAHHYEVDVNRELLGLGAANLGSGLSSGMVVNGSLSKTAVNGSAGARSQVSGLVVAALTVVTLLFLTGLFENLPKATLAAVVIAAVVELIDFPALAALYRIATRQLRGIYGIAARPDFIAAVAALAGVLVFDTLPGLFIGVVVSLLLLVYRASRPHVAVLGQVPGVPRPVRRRRPAPREPARAGDRAAAGRGRAVLRQCRHRPGRRPRPRRRAGDAGRRPGRRDGPLHRRQRGPHARPAHRRPAPAGGRAGDRPRHRPGPRHPAPDRGRGRPAPRLPERPGRRGRHGWRAAAPRHRITGPG
jgi:high affinity sulfate transporter 1